MRQGNDLRFQRPAAVHDRALVAAALLARWRFILAALWVCPQSPSSTTGATALLLAVAG
jgi:hypothetical protein